MSRPGLNLWDPWHHSRMLYSLHTKPSQVSILQVQIHAKKKERNAGTLYYCRIYISCSGACIHFANFILITIHILKYMKLRKSIILIISTYRIEVYTFNIYVNCEMLRCLTL